MKYIIMCGGDYHTDIPKQLLEVKGEPIVARTIRLLKENDIPLSDIFISSNDDRFGAFGVVLLKHKNNYGNGGRWLEAFYPNKDPACYIFGDVVFSPDAIRKIVSTDTDCIQFFASRPPFSTMYHKNWAEPFAFKVNDQEYFQKCIEDTKRYESEGKFHRGAVSWELWQVIKGTPLDWIDYTNYYPINDYTCDVDFPSDLEPIERWIE